MLGAGARQSRRDDLAPIGDVAGEAIDLFVINLVKMIRAKPAGPARPSPDERGVPPFVFPILPISGGAIHDSPSMTTQVTEPTGRRNLFVGIEPLTSHSEPLGCQGSHSASTLMFAALHQCGPHVSQNGGSSSGEPSATGSSTGNGSAGAALGTGSSRLAAPRNCTRSARTSSVERVLPSCSQLR